MYSVWPEMSNIAPIYGDSWKSLDSIIDFQKYVQILDANLYHFVAEDFVESLLHSRMTCTGASFHESWKLTKKFGTTWPARSLDLI